jgi:hypothetical protein
MRMTLQMNVGKLRCIEHTRCARARGPDKNMNCSGIPDRHEQIIKFEVVSCRVHNTVVEMTYKLSNLGCPEARGSKPCNFDNGDQQSFRDV